MRGAGLINFPYSPPTITEDVKVSVYYWWWEYLKRHSGYQTTCEQNGQAEYSKLYADFGDVRGGDFWEWWKSDAPIDDNRKPALGGQENWRGVYLFAEPERPYEFVRIKEPPPIEAYTDKRVLLLQVPMDEPVISLMNRFRAYLDTFSLMGDEDRRGDRAARSSQARYPVVGQPNVKALKATLTAYDLRQSGKKLWEITDALYPNEYDTNESSDKNQMNVIANRYIKKTNAMINNAAQGRFPDITER